MATETTPLLATGEAPKAQSNNIVFRILSCAFLISLSFAFTQVPILYVFRLMECEEYYKVHSPDGIEGDRCSVNAIESSTARSIALLGMSTTVFGTLNLLITGALIKRVGVHLTLVAQTFWPSFRLCCQYLAVTLGGQTGIWIFQSTQMITMFGGPAGYLLVLNSYISEVVEPSKRTGVFGKLQGCVMFGGAFGFLLGGLSGDAFGIRSPFVIALALMITSFIYTILFLPYVAPTGVTKGTSTKGFAALVDPLRNLLPQRWHLPNGQVQKEWGAPLLALGVYLGVLATGYIPLLIQMYSITAFSFSPAQNGYLMSFNMLIRGFFLSFAFPAIIRIGRTWFAGRKTKAGPSTTEARGTSTPTIEAEDVEIVVAPEFEQEPVAPSKAADTDEGSAFDLFFLKWSLVIDCIITGLATFTRHGWQIYLVAFLLPLASGSASAAKSVMIEMCPLTDKADALSAITLVEMTAMLSTMSIFGAIFSGLADVGKAHLTFACNASVAVVAVIILSFCHFPPPGSVRAADTHHDADESTDSQSEDVSGDCK